MLSLTQFSHTHQGENSFVHLVLLFFLTKTAANLNRLALKIITPYLYN